MNSFSVVVLIVAVILATVSALPSLNADQVQDHKSLQKVGNLEADSTLDELILEEDTGVAGDRFRRVTCDVFSVTTKWISFNHAPCAIRCLAKRRGYRGGFCRGGVCYCRRKHHHH